MISAINLHLALLLVPYLDPADLVRACRVCKVGILPKCCRDK